MQHDQLLKCLKVRLQMQPNDASKKGMVQMFSHILRTDGVPGLYRGLTAALLRQITYSTTRFGVYEELKQRFSGDTQPSFAVLVAMASTSGFLGGVAGNPADIMNVRMQNDAALPKEQRRNYKHAIDGLIRMSRDEGLSSLFRGVWPNSMRAVLMTASQLASYDVFKRQILEHTSMGDNLATHFSASLMAGFVATTVCSPVDVIKTRVMGAHTQEGIVSLVTRITASEGLIWMFKGWVPSFIRLGPHTIATFLFLEQHKKIYRKVKGHE
ncbi:Mitochondrial dicarboxylate transporter [Fulvia fulva]|uniref:Mitochondrial dicarboxylate transporter n=1 Tax=Passalora fulva TaxID=5499 RepID=A0A9Q8P3B5_PASFU|nr:Mitochondrial dicarboxylate transporter [Fulvia fulva]KAK4635718.1 Mitochondrial dicarboxylate transporter [Fulvia fulva]KAK4637272.1 Mitochondrial dicarboxylate transporter [Fulvia fulva]UJO11581.1 Mitochondrial dicarboxylate transporter [Fulvia fulva]WPV09478.1 Mitochondrial dicarboxylate transporter [Fulvia fulva]WPV24950.1 Mitochondrial dicarboxylate transporter [Fulvia fulva]